MKGITPNPTLDAYHRMAVSPVGATQSVQKPSATAESAGPSPEVATVSISSQARELALGGAAGPSDPQKVERLKAQVESGQLQFDSTKIAERLIAALR